MAAATPIPDELVIIPLGLLKYNPIKFYIAFFLGKLSITLIAAYLGKSGEEFFSSVISQQIMVVISILLTIAITILLLKVDVAKIPQNIKKRITNAVKPSLAYDIAHRVVLAVRFSTL